MFQRSALLIILALSGCLIVSGQTPTQTSPPAPNTQATSQTNSKPQGKPLPPEVQAVLQPFLAAMQEAQQFLVAGQKLAHEGKPEALAKLNESLERYRHLYEQLNDPPLGDALAKASSPKIGWQKVCKSGEINSLTAMADLYYLSKAYQASLKYEKLALGVIREIRGDKEPTPSLSIDRMDEVFKLQEASTLMTIGNRLKYDSTALPEALEYFQQALVLYRELQKESETYRAMARKHEAVVLISIGQSYRDLNQREKALESFEQALKTSESLPNQQPSQASILLNLGIVHFNSLDYEKAFIVLEKASKISGEIQDQQERAAILNLIGGLYSFLGSEKKAHEPYNRELEILLAPGYLESVKRNIPIPALFDTELQTAIKFQFIGQAYIGLAEYGKAREYLEKGLPFAARDQDRYRIILSNIGDSYRKEENWPKALEYYHQSLALSRKLGLPLDIAVELRMIGETYLALGKLQEARQSLNEVLIIYQSIGVNEKNVYAQDYSRALALLARTYDAMKNRRLAIFYGKQTVNAIQAERGKFPNIELELQRSFLKKNEKPYRRLADWLIAEGRIAEAEQVLAMLKEDEYFDYLRRDDKVASELKDKLQLSLTPKEQEAFNRFAELADQLTALGKEHNELQTESKQYEPGKFPKQARLDELEKSVDAAGKVFTAFLDDLKKRFDKDDSRIAVVQSGTQALLKELKQPRTVIISTIVDKDRLNLIVTTSGARRAHTVAIKVEKLNELVKEFREAVKNPELDPRLAGKKLYDVLFPAALQKDLAGVNADTIIWSLDGTLRYAPMAALWDGKQYLAERYNTALITLASLRQLNQPPVNRTTWQALGVGVSKQAEVEGKTFNALTAVPEELCNIIADPKKKDLCTTLVKSQTGVIAGVNLFDDEFTLPTFKSYLGRYPVVHIASHFSLNAGNEADSYLLLGGGEERKYTLASLREGDAKFVGVDLLTLSACNTAMGTSAKSNGVEVEGFGALAQEQGARSVLATLWAVADSSTRDLMTEFYRILETHPQIGKAEALRKAQLALLQGKYQAGELQLWRGPVTAVSVDNQLLPFKHDANAPYAHPYFWSPFVLMGNWK